jgi:dCMP deaminase
MRAGWDETWMRVAEAMSQRAKCTNRQVGAVIVDTHNRPIAVGYNGAPAGFVGIDEQSCATFCPRSNVSVQQRSSDYSNCVSVHAEANALIFSDRALYHGGTIYVTNPCCWDCSKLVANSGIARVVFKQSAVDAHADVHTSIEFLESCGLQVEVWKQEEK